MTTVKIMDLLERAVKDNASDLFLVAGAPISEKIGDHIEPLFEERLRPADTERLINAIYMLAERSIDHYNNDGDDDFSLSIASLARFRVNTYKQRGSKAVVIRIINFDIPDPKDIGIPDLVMAVANTRDGLVRVSGTAGSGKSTTQACIINAINKSRACHIITLEDPIEYLHRNNKAIVSQREIAVDTNDYATALRACLRQAPDVILLGEMRDTETIHTAITAAETGHLVIATLHTKGAANTIDRIVDSFPSAQQEQVRTQLAAALRTVISQQLIPGAGGKPIPAFEVMHATSAIRNLIRENKTHQIDNAISTGGQDGMITMDRSILSLYADHRIDLETARAYAGNPGIIDRGVR